MLRNYSDDKITDRFISGRNKEREIILDKFKIEEDSFKKYREDDIYQTPRCKSQTKSRQINIIENDEISEHKIYLNLLKTQIFQSSQSCSTGSDKSVRINKNNLIENIRKNLNKSFFNNVNINKEINNNNKILSKSNIENTNNTNNPTIKNFPITNNNINNLYKNIILTNNYSLFRTRKTKNYLLKKRLFEDNEKNNNLYGNIFKESYTSFLNLE